MTQGGKRERKSIPRYHQTLKRFIEGNIGLVLRQSPKAPAGRKAYEAFDAEREVVVVRHKKEKSKKGLERHRKAKWPSLRFEKMKRRKRSQSRGKSSREVIRRISSAQLAEHRKKSH